MVEIIHNGVCPSWDRGYNVLAWWSLNHVSYRFLCPIWALVVVREQT